MLTTLNSVINFIWSEFRQVRKYWLIIESIQVTQQPAPYMKFRIFLFSEFSRMF